MDESNSLLGRCFRRHTQDYAQLSNTPDQFAQLVKDVGLMQRTLPNYSSQDLGSVTVPVTVTLGEYDEFIEREHVEYLARTIPGARLVLLPGVSHFAPVQLPALFNAAVLEFLRGL